MSDLSKSNRKSLNEPSSLWISSLRLLPGWTLRAHGAGWTHRTGCALPDAEGAANSLTLAELIDAKIARFTRGFLSPWNTRQSIRLSGRAEGLSS